MASRENRSIPDYLDALASDAPAPGGGSVTAIVSALAAALAEMVTNFSIGRSQDGECETVLHQSRARLARARGDLIQAAGADERAYAAYQAAVALPKRDESEKRLRQAARQQALIEATDVPLTVARYAAETADVLRAIAPHGNPHLRADTALAALLAEAALRGALLNLRGNAAMLQDESLAAGYLAEAARLERDGRAAARQAYDLATKSD